MDLGSRSSLDHMTISDDSICGDEKAAAARKLFSADVESFNCNSGRFYAANQLGEIVLGWSGGDQQEKKYKAEDFHF
jgi:hypothetical protein